MPREALSSKYNHIRRQIDRNKLPHDWFSASRRGVHEL
jgi:hypothetical protein